VKILFLTPQLPYPPQKGTALRNWGLIDGLASRHELSLLSFRAPGQDDELPSPLLDACERVATVPQPERTVRDRLWDLLTTRHPDMALRLKSEIYGRRLAEWLAQETFDVVQVEGIELAPYLDVVEAAAQVPVVVFDDHNCEYVLQRRVFFTDLAAPARWPGAAYSCVQWLRLRRYEAQICQRADRVLTVSDADAEALKRLVPGLDPGVVPNGIDTRRYHPEAIETQSEENSLVFTGTMDFRPNVDAMLWFVKEALPLIQAEIPDVHIDVVGQRPHPRLDPLRENPNVRLTGFVEDVRPYIGNAELYVAPLRMGGGTRLKLLEAMAMGKAVVATRLGAEGYPVTDGRELVLADTASDFAEGVISLLRSPKRRAALGRTARAFVEQRYDWRAIVPLVETVYPR
jgi:sugar transferase (PEP-CTERM/EpsH1 system associated)